MTAFLHSLLILFFPRLSAAQREIAELRLRLEKAEGERDQYHALYLEKLEYIAVVDGKPRFGVVKPLDENREPPRTRVSRAEIEARQQREAMEDFDRFLKDHPEELTKYQ